MIDTTKYTQLLILKRHWPLSVATGLIVVAVIVPMALGLPNIYRSSTKLSVERQVGMTVTQASIQNGLETRLQLIRNEALSRQYLMDMIHRLDLYPDLRQETSLETVVNRVQRDIGINPNSMIQSNNGPTTLTFTLSFRGDDPEKVAEVTKALARFYMDQNDAMRTRVASKMADDLELQVKEAKKQYDEANSKLQQYITNHPGQLPEQQAIKSAQLATVSAALMAKQARQNALKAQQGTYNLQIANELDRPVSAVTSAAPDQALVSAEAELKKLRDQGAGDDLPELKALQIRIQQLRAQLGAPRPPAGSSITPTAETQRQIYQRLLKETVDELNAINKEVGALEEQSSRLVSELANVRTRNPELDDLTNSIQAKRDVYIARQREYDQVAMTAQLERSQESEEFRVLDEAAVATEPAGPPRLNMILGGIVAAIVLGLGMAVARDQLDTSFHTLDELRGFTTVPVLASIPKIATGKQRARSAAILVIGTCVLLVSLAFIGVGAYEFGQRHVGITRLITK